MRSTRRPAPTPLLQGPPPYRLIAERLTNVSVLRAWVMPLGPILRRELLISSRHTGIFWDRVVSGAVVLAILAGNLVAWDYWGWDRTSVAGMAGFHRATFELIIAVLVAL